MLISVIICTYNRAALLATVLESLYQQTLGQAEYEVIVVDNNSTDETPAVCAAFARRCPALRCIVERQQGLSYARNCGWQAAQGEYVLYIDDDCTVPEGWLAVASEIIQQTAPDVFGGPYFAFYQTPKPAWFPDSYGSWQPAEQATAITPTALHGGNLCLRRELLVQSGGFQPGLGMQGETIGYGEETDLLLRLQAARPETSFYYAPRLFVYHLVRSDKMSITWQIRSRFARGRAAYHVRGLPDQQKGGRLYTLWQMVQAMRHLIWGMSVKTILRDRAQYPYFQNYWCESALRHLRTLGMAYEHYRCLLRS
jgi:glycosyltransferase involved in cell wall biosynthesis